MSLCPSEVKETLMVAVRAITGNRLFHMSEVIGFLKSRHDQVRPAWPHSISTSHHLKSHIPMPYSGDSACRTSLYPVSFVPGHAQKPTSADKRVPRVSINSFRWKYKLGHHVFTGCVAVVWFSTSYVSNFIVSSFTLRLVWILVLGHT